SLAAGHPSKKPTMTPPHITICICTYQRPGLLRRLLNELEHQQTERRFTYSIVVCDNDACLSARPIVDDFVSRARLDIVYCAEPRQNIALARNRAIDHARGDF